MIEQNQLVHAVWKKTTTITIILILGSLLCFLFSTKEVNATVICLGWDCEVSHLNSRLIMDYPTLPGMVDDGFGYWMKTPGGMTKWEVDGIDVSFASGYYLRLAGWDSEKSAWEEYDEPSYSTKSDEAPPEINFGYSMLHNSFLDLDVSFELYGREPSDAIPDLRSTIIETITITNTSETPVSFDWFIYYDFDPDYSVSKGHRSISCYGSTIFQNFNHFYRPRRTKVVTEPIFIKQDGTSLSNNFYGMKFFIPGGGKISSSLPGPFLNELTDNNLTNLDPPPAETLTDYGGQDYANAVQFHFENVSDRVEIKIKHYVHREYVLNNPGFILTANNEQSVNVHFEWEILGSFYPPIAVGENHGANYGSFAVADFTCDGRLDFIAATDQDPPQLYLFKRTRPDEFLQIHLTELSGHGAPDYGLGLIAADLDNDGDMDFLENIRYPNESQIPKGYAWINDGAGDFSRVDNPNDPNKFAYNLTSIYRGWTLSISSTLEDLNGDDYPDLLASAQSSGADTSSPVYILPGSASGIFDQPQHAFDSTNVAATFMTIGDFNNDGLADAVVGGDDDGDPGASYLYIGHGDGTFTKDKKVFDTNPETNSGYDQKGWGALRAYDLDHDTMLDVLAGSALYGPGPNSDTHSKLVWFKGKGGGVFDPGPGGDGYSIIHLNPLLPHPTAFSAQVTPVPTLCEGDFDKDGDVDGTDLALFAADFGRTDCCEPGVLLCEGDFDGDCDVDGSDLTVFAANFGRTNCYKK